MEKVECQDSLPSPGCWRTILEHLLFGHLFLEGPIIRYSRRPAQPGFRGSTSINYSVQLSDYIFVVE